MTTAKLIQILQKMPPDLEASIFGKEIVGVHRIETMENGIDVEYVSLFDDEDYLDMMSDCIVDYKNKPCTS